MKKYPKIVQCDKRGQIVIPKDIRQELDIDEGTAFWMFSVTEEGILLKKVKDETLTEDSEIVKRVKDKAAKIDVDPKNLDKAVKSYSSRGTGRLEEL